MIRLVRSLFEREIDSSERESFPELVLHRDVRSFGIHGGVDEFDHVDKDLHDDTAIHEEVEAAYKMNIDDAAEVAHYLTAA